MPSYRNGLNEHNRTSMNVATLQSHIAQALKGTYDIDAEMEAISLGETKKEFDGDYTFVVFPYVRQIKKGPQDIADALGKYIVEHADEVKAYNVVKGFLNLSMSHAYWKQMLTSVEETEQYGHQANNGEKIMVEFSSPNTNKPLHLGHIRNILLGWSTSKILDAAGYEVIKTQIINDRGIAICKSMIAWKKYGEGETPESSGIKGDHFVGKYYVLFEQKFQEEYKQWQQSDAGRAIFAEKAVEKSEEQFFKGYKNTYFNDYSVIGNEAKDMLLSWEAGDESTRQLWAMMNSWVYDGFETTYKALGVDFDSYYYESDTYLLGKDIIESGLDSQVFYRRDDGSVWINLEDAGMDEKLVLRSDGTSVYMTQDIGTCDVRYQDTGAKRMVYVVADEQNYHFKVLFEIAKRLEAPYAEGLYHLSYGMVDLPSGRMKSREGTVVDADDLMKEVIGEATANAKDRGEVQELTTEEQHTVYENIGLGALKYFILKVTPQRRMIFDPSESVDMQGQTGPYIQNAYVRILSLLRKNEDNLVDHAAYTDLDPYEVALVKLLAHYPDTIEVAAKNYDPSELAAYVYDLAKAFHKFYHEVRILKAESAEAKSFRLGLSKQVARILKDGMHLLGIEMPQRM